MHFLTNNSATNSQTDRDYDTRMTITAAGKVGIGTDSPGGTTSTHKPILHVQNTADHAYINVTSNDGDIAAIRFGDVSDNDWGSVRFNNTSGDFHLINAEQGITIKPTGNLGIGPSALDPERRLHIAEASGSTYVRIGNALSDPGILEFEASRSPGAGQQHSLGEIRWSNDNFSNVACSIVGYIGGSGAAQKIGFSYGSYGEKFSVDQNGHVTTSGTLISDANYQAGANFVQMTNDRNDNEGGWVGFRKNKGSMAAVPVSGTDMGGISWHGSDGDTWERGNWIKSQSTATWTEGNPYGKLIFGVRNSTILTLENDSTATFAGNIFTTKASDNLITVSCTDGNSDAYFVMANSTDANNTWAIGRPNDGQLFITHSTGATHNASTQTIPFKIDTSDNATFTGGVTAASFTSTAAIVCPEIRVSGGGNLQFEGCEPKTHNSHDLGSPNKRWRHIYVADMQMSNEGSGGNEIDGTEGNWTIQEGEDDLFLLNRKNGKKYKFKLEEVV